MGSPDLDYCEFKLAIKDYFTGLPYVDTATGYVSDDVPYESIEYTDEMYEPKQSNLPAVKIVLPSLIARPELRTLFQFFKEGNRVELYDFQPACGDPVFGGFVSANGITESKGQLQIDASDTRVRGKWQHVRRAEFFSNLTPDQFYTRGMSQWVDLINEDFSAGGAVASRYLVESGSPVWSTGYVGTATPASGTQTFSIRGTSGFTIDPYDVFILEGDGTYNYKPGQSSGISGIELVLDTALGGAFPNPIVGTKTFLQQFSAVAQDSTDAVIYTQTVGNLIHIYDNNTGTQQSAFATPQSHHFVAYLQFSASTVNVTVYRDNILWNSVTLPWVFDSTLYYPSLTLTATFAQTGIYSRCSKWRVRTLQPYLKRAPRFVPQSAGGFTYQPNNEEALQLLEFTAERDNTEYRPIYRSYPRMDELELDAISTLGIDASARLDYSQPVTTAGASPQAATTDVANFLQTPPFRLEEGWNLEDFPAVDSRAIAHANEIVRLGASTIDSQTISNLWSVGETGNPAAGTTPTYPYFEQVVNDDRVGLQSINDILAQNELARRTVGVDSVDLKYVEERPFAFRWRAGDSARVKTQSLRSNIDASMRIMRVKYTAGSPIREIVAGRLPFDPSMLRLISESMALQWAYEESGTAPTTYILPFSYPVTLVGGASTPETPPIALDQFTVGTQLVRATLHWYSNISDVLSLIPAVNGQSIYLGGTTEASSTDSGLVTITQYLQAIGSYTFHFTNNGGTTIQLLGAILNLQIRS